MRLNRLLYLLPLALFIGVAVYFVIGLGLDPRKIPSALIDKPAPEFNLPGLEGMGEGFGTADLKEPKNNGVILVNVFASWCIPCRAEHPFLMQLAEQGQVIYGINYKDKAEDARNWLKQLGNPYKRIGVDLPGRTSIDWGVYGVPESFIIDRKGRIRYKQIGPITTPEMAKALLENIVEAAK